MLRTAHPDIIGAWNDAAVFSTGTLAISASTTRLAYGFVAPAAKQVSKFQFYVSGVGGTLASSDIVLDLFSMPTGALATTTAPSASIESRSSVTATPTGAAWVEVTGFTSTATLTAGSHYAFVIRNANGTPGTNNFTVRWTTALPFQGAGSTSYGTWKRSSTDSGSTYGTNAGTVGGWRIEFSDGTFIGSPFSTGGVMGAGDGIYSDRETGVIFTAPSAVKLSLAGALFYFSVTGTPTGDLRCKLYQGTSLIATGATATSRGASGSMMLCLFSSAQQLTAGASYRLVVGETTQSDASSSRYNLQELTIHDADASRGLLPLGGWAKTYWDGATWTDTNTSVPGVAAILDGAAGYAAAGGGLLRHPGMGGGLI